MILNLKIIQYVRSTKQLSTLMYNNHSSLLIKTTIKHKINRILMPTN